MQLHLVPQAKCLLLIKEGECLRGKVPLGCPSFQPSSSAEESCHQQFLTEAKCLRGKVPPTICCSSFQPASCNSHWLLKLSTSCKQLLTEAKCLRGKVPPTICCSSLQPASSNKQFLTEAKCQPFVAQAVTKLKQCLFSHLGSECLHT